MSQLTEIPQKFFGKFKLDRSDKFEDYLANKGVNWLLRKLIARSTITKILTPGEKPNTYIYKNLSAKMNLSYDNFSLNEEFEDKGFDNEQHKIIFQMQDADTLTEKHIRLNIPNDAGEVYYYSIENNELVLTMKDDKLTCKRFFKREQ